MSIATWMMRMRAKRNRSDASCEHGEWLSKADRDRNAAGSRLWRTVSELERDTAREVASLKASLDHEAQARNKWQVDMFGIVQGIQSRLGRLERAVGIAPITRDDPIGVRETGLLREARIMRMTVEDLKKDVQELRDNQVATTPVQPAGEASTNLHVAKTAERLDAIETQLHNVITNDIPGIIYRACALSDRVRKLSPRARDNLDLC